MRKSIRRSSTGKKQSVNADEMHTPANSKSKAKDATNNTMSAFYQAGPMVAMPAFYGGARATFAGDQQPVSGARENIPAEQNQAAGTATQRESGKNNLQSMLVPGSLPPVSGRGTPGQDYAMATSVNLDGRTDANFDGGTFATENVRVSSAEGCSGCGESDPCIRAQGTLVTRYHVTTTVTLPCVNDFPDLTACQRTRVQNAITSVLAPHEQEHVRAFNQYNGVVRTPFNVVLCRSAFDSRIQDMFNQQASARRASAQAASDALDPFHFTVDINCAEPVAEGAASGEVPTADKAPAVNEVPAADEMSTASEVSALSEVSAASEVPTASKVPTASEVPAASEVPTTGEAPTAVAVPTAD